MTGDYEKQSCKDVGALLRRLRTSLGWTLEDVVEKVEQRGVSLTTSTLSRAERGLAALTPPALVAVCDTLGITLDQIEDVIRAAHSRREVLLREGTFEEFVAEAKKAAAKGDIARARDLLVAAEDWVSLHPEDRPPQEQIVDLWLWLGAACTKVYQLALARRYAINVLNSRRIDADDQVQALSILLDAAILDRDTYNIDLFSREIQQNLELASPPVHARAEFRIGKALVVCDRAGEAVSILASAARAHHRNGELVEALRADVLHGYAMARSGQITAGRRKILTALRLSPRRKNVEIYFWCHQHLGLLAYELGDHEGGFSHMREAALAARAAGSPAQEFFLWYLAWRAEKIAGRERQAIRIERTLKRLLRHIGYHTPEAEDFALAVLRPRPRKETRP